MTRLIFFLQSIVLTFCLVAILQIEISHRPLEAHLKDWVATSALMDPLRTTASAAATGIRRGWDRLNHFVKEKLGSSPSPTLPPTQRLNFQFERSKEFLQEQALRAKAKAEKALDQLESKGIDHDPPAE